MCVCVFVRACEYFCCLKYVCVAFDVFCDVVWPVLRVAGVCVFGLIVCVCL